MALLIVAVGAGFFFGLYYNFLALVPATMTAALICYASAEFAGHGATSSLLATIVPAIGLQGGYMVGLTSQDLVGQFLARINGAQSNRA